MFAGCNKNQSICIYLFLCLFIYSLIYLLIYWFIDLLINSIDTMFYWQLSDNDRPGHVLLDQWYAVNLIGQWTRMLLRPARDLGDDCNCEYYMYLCQVLDYNRRRRQNWTSYFGMKLTCSSKDSSRPDGRSRTTINATPIDSSQSWCLVLSYCIAAFCILHSTAATMACQSGISFSQHYNTTT